MNSLYQYFNKGSWRALSFIIAIILTLSFFFNIDGFVTQLRTQSPLWIMAIIWAVVIAWIHGVGFEIRHLIWKICFFPLFSYLISITALIQHWI